MQQNQNQNEAPNTTTVTDSDAISAAINYAKISMSMDLDPNKFQNVYVSKISETEWKVVFVASVTKSFSFKFNPITRIVSDYEVGD